MRTLLILGYLISKIILPNNYSYSHFRDEETETQIIKQFIPNQVTSNWWILGINTHLLNIEEKFVHILLTPPPTLTSSFYNSDNFRENLILYLVTSYWCNQSFDEPNNCFCFLIYFNYGQHWVTLVHICQIWNKKPFKLILILKCSFWIIYWF